MGGEIHFWMNYYLIILIFFLVNFVLNRYLRKKLMDYSQSKFYSNISGKEVSEKILFDFGIRNVNVLSIKGKYTDHYNPLDKTINLSENVFNNKDIISIAIAAHETSHALQHNFNYTLLKIRNALVFILNFCSIATNIIMIIGILLFYGSNGKYSLLLKTGMFLFFINIIFLFITFSIELDANKRAIKWIRNQHVIYYKDFYKIKRYFKLAIFTYILSLIYSSVQFLYIFSFFTEKIKNKRRRFLNYFFFFFLFFCLGLSFP